MLNEGAILTYLKRKNIISPNKPTTYNPALKEIHEEYAGGFLLEPKPGLYRWLIDDDYSSLYPSIIRSLNLGIETYVGRIVDRVDKEDCWWGLEDLKSKDPDMLLLLENKKNKTTKIKVSKLIEIIETENLTISASGALFQTNKKSVVCEILEDWFNKRKIYKKKMKEAYLGGDKEKGNFYNSRQHSFKILLNSVYGCYAINGWRYTDGRKILSSAITLTGQRMIKETIKEANRLMGELLEK
jgi:DNA polymerase elongation subunit (family B)